MQLSIGPVPMSSARAWVDHALSVLEHLETDEVAFLYPAEVVSDYSMLLLRWSAALDDSLAEFSWTGELTGDADPDMFFRYWFHLAAEWDRLASEGMMAGLPEAAAPFAVALTSAVLGGLVAAGKISVETADQFCEQWPRLVTPMAPDPRAARLKAI